METKRDYIELINFSIKSSKNCDLKMLNIHSEIIKLYLKKYRQKFIDNE
jgi:hypothetical protein